MMMLWRLVLPACVCVGVYAGTRWGLAWAAYAAVLALLPPMQVKK